MYRTGFTEDETKPTAPVTSEETTPQEPTQSEPTPTAPTPTPEPTPAPTQVISPPAYEEDEAPPSLTPPPTEEEEIKPISPPELEAVEITPQMLAEVGIAPSRGELGKSEYLLLQNIAALPEGGKENPDFRELIKQGYSSDRAYGLLTSPIEINLPATGKVTLPYIEAKQIFSDLNKLPIKTVDGKNYYDTKAISEDTGLTNLYRRYVDPMFQVTPQYVRVVGSRPSTGDILVETLEGARGWIKASPQEVERATTVAMLKDMGILENNKLDALGIVAALSAGITRDQLRTVVSDPVDISRAVVYMQEAQKYYEAKTEYEQAQEALLDLRPFAEGKGHNLQRALREGVPEKTILAAGYTKEQLDQAVKSSTKTGDFISVDTYIDYYMRENGIDPGIGPFKAFGGRIFASQAELDRYDELLPKAVQEYQDKYGSKAYWQNVGFTAPAKLLQIAPALAGVPYVGSLMMIAVPGGKLALGKAGVTGQELTVPDIAIGVLGATSLTIQGFEALVKVAQAQATPYNPRAQIVEMGGIISPTPGIQIPRDYQFTGAYIDQGGGNLIYEIRGPSGAGWILAGDTSKPIQSAFGTQPEAAKIATQKGITAKIEWSHQYVQSVLKEGLLPISKAPKTVLGDMWVGIKPGYIEGNYTPPEIAQLARELFNSRFWSNITDKGNYPGYSTGGPLDPTGPVRLATWIIAPNGQIITNVNMSAIPLETQIVLSDNGFIFVNFASGVIQPTLIVPNETVSVLNTAGIETASEPIIEMGQVGTVRTLIDQALADMGFSDKQIALMTDKDKESAIGEAQLTQIITQIQAEQKSEEIPVSILETSPEERMPAYPELMITEARGPAIFPIPTPTPRPVPRPQPLPQPQPQPSLTQYPALEVSPPMFPEKPPTPPEKPPELPKLPPKPPVFSLIRGESIIAKGIPVPLGSIAWKQGALWKYIPWPWNQNKPITLARGQVPFGALTTGRTPAETIQMIGQPKSQVPKSVSVDLGFVDILITNYGKSISFTGHGEQTDVGQRLESTTIGMSIPAAHPRKVKYVVGKKKKGNSRPRYRGGEHFSLSEITGI